MKITKIKLTSKYFNHIVVLLLSAEDAQRLMEKEEPMQCINEDCDRFVHGCKPFYLSEVQIRKILNFNKESGDYFNKVEYYEKY